MPAYDPALSRAFEGLRVAPEDGRWPEFRETVIAEALPRLWRAAERWQAGEIEIDAVHDVAVELNGVLHAAGLGYFVQPQLEETEGARVALLRTYAVRNVAVAGIEGQASIAVLALEPIGATRTPQASGQMFRGIPLVHVRAITSDAVGLVGVLSSGRAVSFGRPALDAAMNPLVVDEVRSALGSDAARAAEVGALLLRWAKIRGAMYLDVEGEEQVAGRPGRALDELGAELARRDARRLIGRIERRVLRRAQLHELQHALDWRSQRTFEPYEALVAAMGRNADLRRQVLATMELSAWTATFARDYSWFDLVTAIAAAHDEGLPTGYAMAFLVDELASRFEPGAPRALLDGVVDRDRLAAQVLRLIRRGPEIPGAARALWEGWFGGPLETIRLP